MNSQTFGGKLKELRMKRGQTQTELGGELGVGLKQIARYEKDEVIPDHDTIKKMNELFEYDFSSLIYNRWRQGDKKEAEITSREVSALISQNSTLVDSLNRLTRTHEMLVREKTAATVEKQQQFEEAYLTRLAEILEIVADLGVGKKWASDDEAREALNKFLIAPLLKK